VKTAISVFLITVALAMNSLGQNEPADKQPKPQPIDKRIRVSERVLEGIVLKKVLPRPPWSGEPAHEKGVVAIAVLVDYDGTLKSTSPISGDPVLADVAAHAIHQWQFKPFVLNGEPVQVESRIVMKFSKKRADVVPGDR
jgi:Gram-negative bacterial TonB protein C-terminal